MPGNSQVKVRFANATALYGAQTRNTTLTITLTDNKRTWRNTKVITPQRNQSEATFTADKVKTKMKIIISVAPADLLVIARTTGMRYKHAEKDVAQICSELNVDYLVEGSVRHEDDHIAMTLQLIRASDQMHLLSHRYESEIDDFFSLRTEVAEAIATATGITRRSRRKRKN